MVLLMMTLKKESTFSQVWLVEFAVAFVSLAPVAVPAAADSASGSRLLMVHKREQRYLPSDETAYRSADVVVHTVSKYCVQIHEPVC